MTPPAAGSPPRQTLLEQLFRAGLDAVSARRALAQAIERRDDRLLLLGETLADGERLAVLAVGKAACAMAAALEGVAGERIARGLAVTKEGHARPLARFVVREAAHPEPDTRSAAAGREALGFASSLRTDETLVVLLSGGASALLSSPPSGISPDDLARTTAALLAAGADIGALNVVRKHLSVVSGGRLAAVSAARRITVLAISDVIGDALDVIGSGPCAPDPSTFADALDVLSRHGLEGNAIPAPVRARLEAGLRGEVDETPKPGDPRLARVRSAVLARNADALAAVCDAARSRGIASHAIGSALAGEARIAGRRLAALARALRSDPRPQLIVAGGETTVTVRGPGRGGRCQELALAAALELEGRERITLLAAGTDGGDGPTDAAGACADGGSVARARAAGVDAADALSRNDSHRFFAAAGGLVRTGPTHTNVMDLVLVLCDAR